MKIIALNGLNAYCIPNAAIIIGSAMVYEQDFSIAYVANPFDVETELLSEETNKFIRRNSTNTELEFNFQRKIIQTGHIQGCVLKFNTIYPDNYYHFLIEALPSIISLLASEDLNERSVVVSGILHSNMLSAFNFITFPMKISLLQLSEMRCVTADEVVITPDSAYGAHLIKGGVSDEYVFNKNNLRELRNFFKASKYYYTGIPNRRLFVRRRSPRRDLANSHSLEMIAKVHGFDIVDPGELSFFDQITLFSSASVVCGPTGAWVANMLFSASDTEYIIFYPNTYQPKKSLWSGLGEVLSINVTDIYCPISNLNSEYPIHSDFTVQEHAFEQLLSNLGY